MASSSGPAWDPWTVFDSDESEKQRVAQRAELRQRNKVEYQKKLTSPFDLQPHCYRIGYIQNPAHERFYAMEYSRVEHYDRESHNPWLGIGLYWGLVIGIGAYLDYYAKEREQQFRNGEVAYKDRWPKT